jgi:hypothetical protein
MEDPQNWILQKVGIQNSGQVLKEGNSPGSPEYGGPARALLSAGSGPVCPSPEKKIVSSIR